VAERNPNAPPRLAALIDSLLEKSPSNRPASAQVVLNELQFVETEWKLQAATNLANNETKIDSAIATPASHSRRWWIGAAGLIAASLAVAVWQPWGARSPALSTEAATSPETSENALSQPTQPIDLLALIRIPRDTIQGQVQLADGRLSAATTRTERFQIILPWNPPEEYRLRMSVKRTRPGQGHLGLGLSCGADQFSLFIDHPGPEEGRLSIGLSHGDPKVTTERGQRLPDRILPAGKDVLLDCIVRRNEITLLADNAEVWSWQGDMTGIPRLPGGPGAQLFLGGSHRAAFEFSAIEIVPLGSDRGTAP
jgi:hypothetical protein